MTTESPKCDSVAIVGSGAREHAIVLKLLQSSKVDKVYAIPGNPGICLADQERVVMVGEYRVQSSTLLDRCYNRRLF